MISVFPRVDLLHGFGFPMILCMCVYEMHVNGLVRPWRACVYVVRMDPSSESLCACYR